VATREFVSQFLRALHGDLHPVELYDLQSQSMMQLSHHIGISIRANVVMYIKALSQIAVQVD
jgi:hypothetical protein